MCNLPCLWDGGWCLQHASLTRIHHFLTARWLHSVHEIIGTRAHCEPAKGISQKARDYCCKDGDVSKYGTFPESSQGRRSDLDTILAGQPSFMMNMDALLLLPTWQVNIPLSSLSFPEWSTVCNISSSCLNLSLIQLNFGDGNWSSSTNLNNHPLTEHQGLL